MAKLLENLVLVNRLPVDIVTVTVNVALRSQSCDKKRARKCIDFNALIVLGSFHHFFEILIFLLIFIMIFLID